MSEYPEAPAHAGRTCSILLVEDNAINQKVVTLMLGRLGLVPDVAASGIEALASAKSGNYDLVLMDLHMPGMDGVETARRMHEELGNGCPPVIALTADILYGQGSNAVDKSFSECLTKPINSEMLAGCIRRHTEFHVGSS